MRTEVPEVYALYVETVRIERDHRIWLARAALMFPYRVARLGQVLGFLVAVCVLGVAGYALYLNEPWVAGILTAIDLGGLVAVFVRGQTLARRMKSEQNSAEESDGEAEVEGSPEVD